MPRGISQSLAKKRYMKRMAAKKTSKLSKPATRAVAKIAKAVMKRSTETQYICDNHSLNWDAVYGDTVPSSGGSTQIWTCLPQIVEAGGEESYGRRGVTIQPVKHTTDLQFAFATEALIPGEPPTRLDSVAWDVSVHIWYGYVRRYKSCDDVNGNKPFIANNLFEIDGSNQTRFSGRLVDLMFERNKEFAGLKHKTFRMFKDAGNANTLSSFDFPAVTQKKIRLNFKAPKTLKYADDTSFYPENYAPFVIIGYCHNDMTQASNVNNPGPTTNIAQLPALTVCRVNKVWFKDA